MSFLLTETTGASEHTRVWAVGLRVAGVPSACFAGGTCVGNSPFLATIEALAIIASTGIGRAIASFVARLAAAIVAISMMATYNAG